MPVDAKSKARIQRGRVDTASTCTLFTFHASPDLVPFSSPVLVEHNPHRVDLSQSHRPVSNPSFPHHDSQPCSRSDICTITCYLLNRRHTSAPPCTHADPKIDEALSNVERGVISASTARASTLPRGRARRYNTRCSICVRMTELRRARARNA